MYGRFESNRSAIKNVNRSICMLYVVCVHKMRVEFRVLFHRITLITRWDARENDTFRYVVCSNLLKVDAVISRYCHIFLLQTKL